jgi:hypothetical protein
MSKLHSLALRPKSVARSLGLALLLSAAVPMVGSAFAAIPLTNAQSASMQTSLQAAITAANGDAAAIEAAIAQAVENAVAADGDDAAGSITSLILASAEADGATLSEIGHAMAQASASLSSSGHGAAARAIATTLSNEGKTDEIVAYQGTVTSLGYRNLAALAGSSATVTGETGGNVGTSFNTGGGFTGGTGGGGGGGCLNPSCTKL